MHHMCYAWCGCGVGYCVVALYVDGMCAMHVMNDDDAGGLLFGWQNVL